MNINEPINAAFFAELFSVLLSYHLASVSLLHSGFVFYICVCSRAPTLVQSISKTRAL